MYYSELLPDGSQLQREIWMSLLHPCVVSYYVPRNTIPFDIVPYLVISKALTSHRSYCINLAKTPYYLTFLHLTLLRTKLYCTVLQRVSWPSNRSDPAVLHPHWGEPCVHPWPVPNIKHSSNQESYCTPCGQHIRTWLPWSHGSSAHQLLAGTSDLQWSSFLWFSDGVLLHVSGLRFLWCALWQDLDLCWYSSSHPSLPPHNYSVAWYLLIYCFLSDCITCINRVTSREKDDQVPHLLPSSLLMNWC